MNSYQLFVHVVINFILMNHNFPSTTAEETRHRKSLQTRSELLNEQNKYKHVLYTLLSQKYVDAGDRMDDNVKTDDNTINENDRQVNIMEHYNFIVDYLKLMIREINDRLLNLDEDQWDTKYDNIMKLYKEQKELRAKKLHEENKDYLKSLIKLTERKSQQKNDKQTKDSEKAKVGNGHLLFKRSPLENRPIKFHHKIFNFDKNMSVELKDEDRRFATGIYLRGKKPEGEKGRFDEEYAKWQRKQALKEKEEKANQTGSATIAPDGEKPKFKFIRVTAASRSRRDATNGGDATNGAGSTATAVPHPTLPDFIDNFGSAETRTKDQFENMIGISDNRDPSKYTYRMNKFNPHPSAEYFVDRIDNWVSWAKNEVSRISALPSTSPLSTLNYHYSKASMSRFFSLNPRYLQSTDEDGLNKWGGRQILPRSKEDFTFDFRSYAPYLCTDPSEEVRSFNTWRDAVDWSRIPSSRPSTHPYFSVEVDKLINKHFKCVSCKTYETKDLHRYIDHLYEHYLHNSLMIPSFEEILTELRRRESLTGTETWRREF